MSRRSTKQDTNGDEYTVISKGRHVEAWCYKAGAKKKVKRRLSRKVRKKNKEKLTEETDV